MLYCVSLQVKCNQYWPNSDSQTYGDITVTFKSNITTADFVIRCFDVQRVRYLSIAVRTHFK